MGWNRLRSMHERPANCSDFSDAPPRRRLPDSIRCARAISPGRGEGVGATVREQAARYLSHDQGGRGRASGLGRGGEHVEHDNAIRHGERRARCSFERTPVEVVAAGHGRDRLLDPEVRIEQLELHRMSVVQRDDGALVHLVGTLGVLDRSEKVVMTPVAVRVLTLTASVSAAIDTARSR